MTQRWDIFLQTWNFLEEQDSLMETLMKFLRNKTPNGDVDEFLRNKLP